MFGVECFDTHDVPISHYTQWDINQTLKIVLYGMDDGYMKNAPYVHFANIKMSEALVVRSTLQGDDTVLVDIPNQLLQESYPLLIYVYLNDSSDASSQRTIVKIEIPVHKRARPSDYEYVENIDKITAEVIKQEIYDEVMDEVNGGNIAYPYVTFIDESTGKHVRLKVSDEKFGLYVDSTNRQLLDTGDIVNNLMTNSSTKVLSASMGTTLKNMIDVIPDQIDEKIEKHDSSPTSHSDIRDSITEVEKKIDDIMLDDTISGSGMLTTTDTLVNSSPIEMRVKGKTWVNRWPVINTVEKGVTVATADNGLITLSGQNTASDNSFPFVSIEGVAAGKQYTLMISKNTGMALETFYVYAQAHGADGGYLKSYTLATAVTTTITLPAKTTSLRCGFIIKSGQSVSWTGRVMLVDGTEAPDCFTPPASITSVQTGKLVTAGKNLLARMGPKLPYTIAGITFSDNGDGGIRISGTATVNAYYSFFNTIAQKAPFIPSGTYTASLTGMVAGVNLVVGYFDYEVDGSYSPWLSIISNKVTESVDRPVYLRPFLSVASGTTVDTVVYPQLEFGSTATAYEPPTITQTPLPEVELRSLPNGTCDELVIKADGTCEVERKTVAYQVQGTETWAVDEHTTGQKYVSASGLPFTVITNRDDFISDKYSTGNWNTNADKYAYVPLPGTMVICDNRFTDNETAKQILASEKPWFVCVADTTEEPQSPVTLPSFPSDKSNIYTTSNVPTAGLTVRYWKKGGELVANLYKLLRNHLSQSETS